jgi:hypothetical protein
LIPLKAANLEKGKFKMPILIEIFGFKVIPYKNKKSGADEKMVVYQALLRGDGSQPPAICELMLPKDHPELAPGMYHGELTPTVDFQSKRLGGAFSKLTPARSAAQPARVA